VTEVPLTSFFFPSPGVSASIKCNLSSLCLHCAPHSTATATAQLSSAQHTHTRHSLLFTQVKCVGASEWFLVVFFPPPFFFSLFFVFFSLLDVVGGLCIDFSFCHSSIQWLGWLGSGSPWLSSVCNGRCLSGFLFQPRVSCVHFLAWHGHSHGLLLCSLHNEGLYILFKSFLRRDKKKSIVCTSDGGQKEGDGGEEREKKTKHWKENLNYLFCRTWLEQKPVQGRSLRTGVESHFLLIWKQTHDKKKKMCTKTKKCSKRWHWGTGVWGTFSKIRLNWPHTEKSPKLSRSVLFFLFCIFYMGFCFLFFITVFLKKKMETN